MLRIVEPQHGGCLAHGVAADDEVTGAMHKEATDGIGGGVASELFDKVAEIVG